MPTHGVNTSGIMRVDGSLGHNGYTSWPGKKSSTVSESARGGAMSSFEFIADSPCMIAVAHAFIEPSSWHGADDALVAISSLDVLDSESEST